MNYYLKIAQHLLTSNEFILPSVNASSSQIAYWLFDMDHNGKVQREIALDLKGVPAAYYPNKDAPYGFVADSEVLFKIEDWKGNQIEKSVFEKIWTKNPES